MDLVINTYGTRIGSSGERIVLTTPKLKQKKEYSIRRLEKIVILRPSSITTPAVRLALKHNVDIVYTGYFGKPVGRIFASEPKGIAQLRRQQLKVATSSHSYLIAKRLITAKCQSQIAYLRFLAKKHNKNFTKNIVQAETMVETIAKLPNNISTKEQLFGIEGYIADKYFSALRKLFRFSGRNPHSRDKFNSTLNYGYGILYNEIERACLYVGLDPYLGFLHSERYGKPSLVLDLIEEFRVPVIDSVIIPLFIVKSIRKSSNFTRKFSGEYQLSQTGKTLVVESVMKRLHQNAFWSGKKYPVKKIIEQQIRFLARYILGKEQNFSTIELSHLFTKND